jgi:hypothetical protein
VDSSDESPCHVPLVSGSHHLQVIVNGVFKDDGIRSARAARPITVEFDLRDGAALSAPLRDPGRDVGASYVAAMVAEDDFARPDGARSLLRRGVPVPEQALAEAEARLGFALPDDYRSLLRHAGAIVIGDYGVVGPARLATGDRQLPKVWGHATDHWPEVARARIARSVALLVDARDGVGAGFHVADPSLCGGHGGFLWMRDGELASFIRALFDGTVDCRPFGAVLGDLHRRSVVGVHAKSLYDEQNVVLFDSGAAAHKWWLRIDAAAGRVGLTPTEF